MIDITDERLERFKKVIGARQLDLTIILEDVHDPHNIGAVLRTCDSVGIHEIYVIYNDPRLQERGVKVGHKSASGANQWIDIHYYEDVDACIKQVRSQYEAIYGTHLDKQSKSLYELDLVTSCALAFGNEHAGLSAALADHLDANFIIPQHGFVKSLNISVACAVSLYEAQRQRLSAQKYDGAYGAHDIHEDILESYRETHSNKKIPK